MRAFAAAALLLLSAGCLQGDPASTATVDARAPDTLAPVGLQGVFHDFTANLTGAPADVARAVGGQYSIGQYATEPTIGAHPDGTLFMTAMAPRPVRGQMPTILRSDDKGQSWYDVGPGTHVNTNDPYVYVDPDTGRVFMSDILPLSCTFLSWSDDKGESWTTNPYACGNSHVNDHQTIVTAWPRALPVTPLYPKIVYICTNDVAYFACATSLNGGLTFGAQVPVDVGVDPSRTDMASGEEVPICGATTAHMRAGPDGKVYLPKSECSIQASRPVVYVTADDGLTWTKKVISETIMEGHEIGFAIDEENNLYATFPSQEGRMLFAASSDGGQTWTEARDVTAPGVTATMFVAAAARGAGSVSFAYIGSTIEGGYEGKGTGNAGIAGDLLGQPDLPEWDGATWNAYIGVITDVFGSPILQTVTVNDPLDPLARGLCGRTRCHGMNDFIDMVVDAEGRPWVAFVDVCTRECVTDASIDADEAIGFAGTLRQGPALVTGLKELPALAPPPDTS